jgi:Na+/H+ antiporter NhaD/arsenite permease-like protein
MRLKIKGVGGVVFMGVIVGAMFVRSDLTRTGLMFAAAAGSYFTARKEIHAGNEFNFAPVIEVAVLFAGIFATMMPALDWLRMNAEKVVGAAPSPGIFFWWPGTLSSFLDNAPAYLSFLAAMTGSLVDPATAAHAKDLLARGGGMPASAGSNVIDAVAATLQYFPAQCAGGKVGPEQIQLAVLLAKPALAARLAAFSVASVFFGANTYIGNGPNFMVKSIADERGAPSPTFLGYILKWTVPVMAPLLILEWLIFFR